MPVPLRLVGELIREVNPYNEQGNRIRSESQPLLDFPLPIRLAACLSISLLLFAADRDCVLELTTVAARFWIGLHRGHLVDSTAVGVTPLAGLADALNLQSLLLLPTVQIIQTAAPGCTCGSESDAANCAADGRTAFTVYGISQQGSTDNTDDGSGGGSLLFLGHPSTTYQSGCKNQYQ